MSKIISFREELLKKAEKEVLDILASLEDYEITVSVTPREIRLLLEEFLTQYEEKDIIYWFYEMMTGHFEDIAITAIEEEKKVDIDYILKELTLLELLDSPIEIIPKDTRKTVQKVKKQLERGPKLYEGKHHKKL